MNTEVRNIPEAFLRAARLNSMKTFEIFKKKDVWKVRNFKESTNIILSVASALIDSGVKNGDKVAILSQTRSEWLLSDLAIQFAGATTVPIYPGIQPEIISYILEHSESKILFVERRGLLRNVKIPKNVKNIIVYDSQETGEGYTSFEKFQNQSHEKIDIESIKPDDLATIVYTSGTTGYPKGVMLTHKNILSMVSSVSDVIHPRDDDIIFAWLPFAHIFGRLIIFYAVRNAVTVAYAENIAKIVDNLKEVKPTLFPSVPRIYEKAYEKIKQSSSVGIKKNIFDLAEKVAERYAEYIRDKLAPPLYFSLIYKIMDLLVYSKIRQAFGGRIRLCISGGAAIPTHIAKFFTGAGIKLLEGYGLTETSSVVTVNLENKFKFGSIGLPIPQVYVKISEDGELLIKSDSVMKGYYKLEEETKNAFTEDGWLKTGDIVEMDDEGFLFFKGRKKNIIVTSFGKNIAPEPIELEIQKDPLVGNVAVFGDEKPYLVALVSLNEEEVSRIAKEKGLNQDLKQIAKSDWIRQRIQQIIDEVNSKRPSYEKIHRFEIVEDVWTPESGELTPTLKTKRYFIYKKYKDLIEKMYS